MPDNNRTGRQLIDSIRTVKTDGAATPAPDQRPGTGVTVGTGSDISTSATTGTGTGNTPKPQQAARAATDKAKPKPPVARAANRSIAVVRRTPPRFGATDPAYQSRGRIWPD